MNHYYNIIAMRKLADMRGGRLFSEEEARQIADYSPVSALEAYVNGSDGLTDEYIACTTERILMPQGIKKDVFWKDYFWRYSRQKETKKHYDHQILLNQSLFMAKINKPNARDSDFENILCRVCNLFRFMFGGKMD
jgi:hypothetical protein